MLRHMSGVSRTRSCCQASPSSPAVSTEFEALSKCQRAALLHTHPDVSTVAQERRMGSILSCLQVGCAAAVQLTRPVDCRQQQSWERVRL